MHGSLSLIADHRNRPPQPTIAADTTVSEAADALAKIVTDQLNTAPAPSGDFGYFLGGCDPKSRTPACFKILVLGGKVAATSQLKIGEASFTSAIHEEEAGQG